MEEQAARAQQVPQKIAHLSYGGPKDDANAGMVANQLVDGNEVEPALERCFRLQMLTTCISTSRPPAVLP
jgi:hypothetical protein